MGGEANALEQAGRFETLELFGSTPAVTGTTTTGSIINVSKAAGHAIMIDLTGATGTGDAGATFYARCEGMEWVTLRVMTATGNLAVKTSQAFILNSTGVTTGCIAGFTGMTRWDQMRVDIELGTMTNVAHTVTIKDMTTPDPFVHGGV